MISKTHFMGWLLVTVVNTVMALSNDKQSRMFMLIFVVVLQFVTLLLFMIDYERMGRIQWRKKEESLKKKLTTGINS